MEPNDLQQNIPPQIPSQPIPSFPGKHSYLKSKKILVLMLILGVMLPITALSVILLQPNPTVTNRQSPQQPTQRASKPTTSTETSTNTTPTNGTWVDYLDSERNSSFKHPNTWEIIEATNGDYIEYEIRHPDKTAYVLIAVYPTGEINSESDIKAAILLRENDLRSDEKNKVLEFISAIDGNTGSFTASGEEIFFNFAKNETLTSSTFNFQEKGLYKVGEKSIILHGATLPSEQNEKITKEIIDSFELK